VAALDMVLVAVVGLSALIGLSRGIVREVLSLGAWVLALAVAYLFAPELGASIADELGTFRVVLAFLAIFLTMLILAGLVQWLVGKLIQTTGLSGTDRLLGLFFGGARGLVVCLVALIAMRPFVQEAGWWQASVLRNELLAFEERAMYWAGRAGSALGQIADERGLR
jgi:membrane protein required for colicin V production